MLSFFRSFFRLTFSLCAPCSKLSRPNRCAQSVVTGDSTDLQGDRLGDRYDSDRYVVKHKLGFDNYSTVWSDRDSQHQRYVAPKVPRASVIFGTGRDCHPIYYFYTR